MTVHRFPNGTLVLYVPTGDNDRVLGFRLDPKTGLLEKGATPFTETAEQKGSFPDDVVVVPLEGDCTPP